MRKKIMYGLVASVSMISVAAHAEDATTAALTTKGYVDSGLKYVYDAIKGDVSDVQDDVDEVKSVLSDGNGGLIDVGDLKDDVDEVKSALSDGNGEYINVSELKDTVDTLEAASKEYVEGTGIDITPNAQGKNVVSLDLGTTQNNTAYVFKTDANGVGSWQAMEIESTWQDSDFESFLNPVP